MSRHRRGIIRIDEEKCDGCGICADACHEGAIRIIDGKAKLVRESYCDGLGDCIGPCPQDAIHIEEREADDYDEEAVRLHLAEMTAGGTQPGACPSCPGSAVRSMKPPAEPDSSGTVDAVSKLTHWPVQITLVPPGAPFLRDADVLIAADCVPFAFADFHRRFISGRAVLVGCPKLDDAGYYLDKLTEMFSSSGIRSLTVVYMEVPCCGGLVRLVTRALSDSGADIPLRLVRIGVNGDIQEDR